MALKKIPEGIFLLKKWQNPHLNIEYRWGMNAVNASDREIWSKKQYNTYRKLLFLNLQKGG